MNRSRKKSCHKGKEYKLLQQTTNTVYLLYTVEKMNNEKAGILNIIKVNYWHA